MNSLLGSLALLPLQKILNHLLASDPYLTEKLIPFAGKSVEVISVVPSANLVLSVDNGQILLSALSSEELMISVDATISGSGSDLVNLLLNQSQARALANPALSISGDAELLQDLLNTIRELDLQWSDYLAPLLGDVLSNKAEQMASASQRFSHQAHGSMRRNVDDYLKEEAKLVPDETSIEVVNEGLDRLRLQIDRAEARTKRLHSRLSELVNT